MYYLHNGGFGGRASWVSQVHNGLRQRGKEAGQGLYCAQSVGQGSCAKKITWFELPTYTKADSTQSFLSLAQRLAQGEEGVVRFEICQQSNIKRWGQNSHYRYARRRGQNQYFRAGLHLQKMLMVEIVLFRSKIQKNFNLKVQFF